MASAMARTAEAVRVEKLSEVGRYALGVQWGDGHDSILPFRVIRRACPCEACAAQAGESVAAEGERLVQAQVLGGKSAFLRWADGHETVLMLEELRDLCRCARCAGEPDYPISGS
jgi:DUF971 family protein